MADSAHEKAPSKESAVPLEQDEDHNLVFFDGPNDPEDPLNWSKRRKYLLVGLLSAMQTMVNLGTLMCTPAVPLILESFSSKSNDFYSVLLVSIWELGEACGPLIVAPLSEYFGRYPVYHTANVMFTVWCIASALSQSIDMMIAFRFFSGLSVASVTLDAAVVGDLFPVEQRGTVQSILGLAPLIGPVFGPTIGGVIANSINWRWMFWILAIGSGLIEVGFIFSFRETYKVTILRKKAKRLRKETGNSALRPSIDRPNGTKAFLQQVYVSVVFAYLYILLTTLTNVFESNYGFSTQSASLVYIGLGLGMVGGMLCCSYTSDKYVMRNQNRQGGNPEQRLVPMIAGGIVIPLGLLLYGWTANMRYHWIFPVLGLAICGFSVATTLISSFSYLVDAFGIYSASAIAAIITLRCITGVVLPLAGPALFARLGLGWGATLLALIALAFIPVPIAMMRVGGKIRNSSKLKIIF